MTLNNERVCPRCKKTFGCEATEKAGCWCMELPPVLTADGSSECLCPNCLSAEIETRLKAEPGKAAPYLRKAAKSVLTRNLSLQEDLDYYINDEGNWVFTTFYHLKRGYCCQNGCKHCPYGFKKTEK